ncbi:MAG: 50S ribosomal protein L6 [Chloroflexi bacterium RBG_19FT_COMBO_49_13]|nr:MAG: 50S ribosomal protein L6 [Chloroflexi bacterium RBG_19FT_COMBO_49_13]
MSRIGRLPVVIPPHVDVHVDGTLITVKGPKGALEFSFHPDMSLSVENGIINVTRPSDARTHRALHGTTRALIHNMVTGVSTGFERILEINGVGYRAEVQGKNLVLNLGYSHPIVMEPPEGIAFEVDLKTRQIKVTGPDKQKVGQIADTIRKQRPPEPYLGKGIKYLEEKIRRKAGKSGKG